MATVENLPQKGSAINNTPASAALLKRRFTKSGEDVWESVHWGSKDARIFDFSGKVHFELKEIEVPVSWSQTAVNIVGSKYLRRGANPETSIRQLIGRGADTITGWGDEDGYFN